MSAVLAFLKVAWPFLAAGAAGAYGGYQLSQVRYDALDAKCTTSQAQVALDKAAAEKTARDAVEAQIQIRLTTEARNGQILSQLAAERDSVAADRDFARRLLAAAQAEPPTANHQLPQAADRPATFDSAQPSGDRPLVADLGIAAGECRDAIQGWAALQAELIPQLRLP